MRRFSDRHPVKTLSELNVTPMLDLAFVLLIIFMITTPLMENSVELVLPSGKAAENAVEPSAVQIVSISRNETMKLNDKAVDLGQLATELEALKETKPQLGVVIRSHRELPVQKLIDVMDVLQRVRITHVGVVTNPEE